MYNQFKQHIDNKLSSLGVGQIHLIKSWLYEMRIKNYVINDDLTIDVDSHVYLNKKNLKEFPDYIQFNNVEKSFSCGNNNLISLRGCPKIVKESFYCYKNQLTFLEGCPEFVGLEFNCSNNKREFTEDEVRKYCDVKFIFV